ncbi:hypothetical protein KMT30_48485 [Streptomyces sp. IBSBF 2953]|nr:hypothetical protein [Streptomyces hayashii]
MPLPLALYVCLALPLPVRLPLPLPVPVPSRPSPAVTERASSPARLPRPDAGPHSGTERAASGPAQTQAQPGFDPRALTDFQLDELTHRLTGRITRLLRTELRLDRERIGRLRDPRH